MDTDGKLNELLQPLRKFQESASEIDKKIWELQRSSRGYYSMSVTTEKAVVSEHYIKKTIEEMRHIKKQTNKILKEVNMDEPVDIKTQIEKFKSEVKEIEDHMANYGYIPYVSKLKELEEEQQLNETEEQPSSAEEESCGRKAIPSPPMTVLNPLTLQLIQQEEIDYQAKDTELRPEYQCGLQTSDSEVSPLTKECTKNYQFSSQNCQEEEINDTCSDLKRLIVWDSSAQPRSLDTRRPYISNSAGDNVASGAAIGKSLSVEHTHRMDSNCLFKKSPLVGAYGHDTYPVLRKPELSVLSQRAEAEELKYRLSPKATFEMSFPDRSANRDVHFLDLAGHPVLKRPELSELTLKYL